MPAGAGTPSKQENIDVRMVALVSFVACLRTPEYAPKYLRLGPQKISRQILPKKAQRVSGYGLKPPMYFTLAVAFHVGTDLRGIERPNRVAVRRRLPILLRDRAGPIFRLVEFCVCADFEVQRQTYIAKVDYNVYKGNQ